MYDDRSNIIEKIELIVNASEQELNNFFSNINAKELTQIFMELKKRRALTWKDRMLLQMIDKTPNLTFWASDRNYKVRLWEGQCNSIYGKNYYGESFYDFISPLERINAMQDSMLVINSDASEVGTHIKSFENYYTNDIAGNYAKVEMITNSVQLIDTDSNETYYGEVGLHLNLEEVQKRYIEQQNKLKAKQKIIEEEWDDLLKEVEQRSTSILSEIAEIGLSKRSLNSFRKKIDDLQRKWTAEINIQKSKWVDTYEDDLQKIRDSIEQKYNEIDEGLESKEIAENTIQNIKTDSGITKARLKGRIESEKLVIEMNFTQRIASLNADYGNCVFNEKIKKRQEIIRHEKNNFIDSLSILQVEIDNLFDGGILMGYQDEIIDKIATEALEYLEKEELKYDG